MTCTRTGDSNGKTHGNDMESNSVILMVATCNANFLRLCGFYLVVRIIPIKL